MINLRAALALRTLWAAVPATSLLSHALSLHSLTIRPAFAFAFMQLF